MSKNTISRTTKFPIIFAALSCRRVGKTGRQLIKDIVYWFFYLQFQTRHRPKKRPVVSVDHPLDETIPFRSKDVRKYMFFIPLWMKSISFYWKNPGRKSVPDGTPVDRVAKTVEFLDELRLLYRNAGYVYNKCSSTTRRPGLIPHPVFLQIHFFDPHLHCIPSLHVSVVLFNYLKMRELLAEAATRPGEYDEEIEYCRRTAVEIIDTILTVKQHSINCVAAGLFFVNAYHPQFTEDECREICRNLLSTVDEEVETLEAIREYTLNLFEWFLAKHDKIENPEAGSESDARDVIVDFLKLYEAGERDLGGDKVERNQA
ncbi:MAG: hypothetical protein JEY99_04660 [Spirochaetales bacterium]|nr:hypothetical protein [Spirochaetales bacterium]